MLDHGIGGAEAVILLLIVLVVFGSKRLPDSARALGRSLRIFKAETRGLAGTEPLEPAHDPASPVSPLMLFDSLTGEPLVPFHPVTGERLRPWEPTDVERPAPALRSHATLRQPPVENVGHQPPSNN